MKRKAAVTAAMAAALAATVLASVPVVAQTQFNMTVFPAKVELTVEAGASREFEINVRNDSSEPQALRVYFMDYLIRPDNSFVFKEPGHYSYSCAKWLDTDSGEMVVQPGETAAKPFVVSVPGGAEPGGHYGVIFFEQTPMPGQEQGEVKATGRVGVVTLITVPGEIIREGVIKDVQVSSAWWWPTRKLPLLPVSRINCRVVFENRGNVHLTVRGRLTFSPSFGWGAGTVDLGEITVLPKTTRYLEAVLGESPKTAGQAPATSAPGQPQAEPPFMGSYRVHAEVQYGPSLEVFDTTRTADSGFNVYPLSLLVIPLAVVALVILLLFLLKKLKSRKAKRGGGDKESRRAEEDRGRRAREGEKEEGGRGRSGGDEAEAGPGDGDDVGEAEESGDTGIDGGDSGPGDDA